MPFRHAHWGVLLLFPVIIVAFWPGYFGQLRVVPWALHGHGIAASLWLGLLALQLWSIHARRASLHRTAGMVLFLVVPVFAGASMAAVKGEMALFAAKADPFHAANGARLALDDLVSLVTFVGLVRHGLVVRRHARRHASAMLATAILVLPPILARLFAMLPDFRPVFGLGGFELAFHLGEVCAILVATGLYLADRRHGRAFAAVALSIAMQSLLFETIGKTAAWIASGERLLFVPASLLFAGGAGAALAALWHGWAQVPARRIGRPIGAVTTAEVRS